MRKLITVISIGLAILSIGCGVQPKTNSPSTSSTEDSNVLHPGDTMPTQDKKKYVPTPQDFTLTIKIIEKQCFGSAGCSVTFRIDIAYSGEKLSNDQTFEVIYKVTGGEDEKINRFKITGDTATYNEQEFISTKSSKSVLTATVTEVNEL